jgi:hypothetical protein
MTMPIGFLRTVIAALALLTPAIVYAQTVDPAADKTAVDKVMHDYFEAYSRGDMAAVMNFISVPFMVQGPKGFTAFTTANEALDWYTRFHDAAVKQGYAKNSMDRLRSEAPRPILCHRERYVCPLQDRWQRAKQVRRDLPAQ